jgi:tetratricopeptide (TPR) repeat protein
VIALAASGYVSAFVLLDLGGGAALIDRALVFNSNWAEAWFWGGWVKNWLGEPETAIERFARAIRLNPLDPFMSGVRTGTAHAHFFLGHYGDAASWAAMALQDNPDFQPALRMDAASNAMAGRLEQAQNAVARLRQLNPSLRVSNLKDVLGPLSARRRSRSIRGRVTASRAARMTTAATVRQEGEEPQLPLLGTYQPSRDV